MMSKIKIAVVSVLIFLCQICVIAARQGASGERLGKGAIVLQAAQVIDGTGAEAIKNSVIYKEAK